MRQIRGDEFWDWSFSDLLDQISKDLRFYLLSHYHSESDDRLRLILRSVLDNEK